MVSKTFQALFDKAIPGDELARERSFSTFLAIFPPPAQHCHQMGYGRWICGKDAILCDPTELVISLAKEAEDGICIGMRVHAAIQGDSKQFCLAPIQIDGDKPAHMVWVFANLLGSREPLKTSLAEHFI